MKTGRNKGSQHQPLKEAILAALSAPKKSDHAVELAQTLRSSVANCTSALRIFYIR